MTLFDSPWEVLLFIAGLVVLSFIVVGIWDWVQERRTLRALSTGAHEERELKQLAALKDATAAVKEAQRKVDEAQVNVLAELMSATETVREARKLLDRKI